MLVPVQNAVYHVYRHAYTHVAARVHAAPKYGTASVGNRETARAHDHLHVSVHVHSELCGHVHICKTDSGGLCKSPDDAVATLRMQKGARAMWHGQPA